MLYTGPTYADHAGLFRADSNGRRVAHTGLRLVSYGEIQGNISERDVPLSSFLYYNVIRYSSWRRMAVPFRA